MSAYQGVDLSSIPRQNLYATPRTPTTITSISTGRSPSRISTSALASPYRATIASANASASNAGRKRSRMPVGTSSISSNKPGRSSPIKPAQYRPSSRSTLHQHNNQQSSISRRTSTFSPPPPADYLTPGHVSPPPLANSKYHLSNGFDTPTAAQADAYDRPLFSVEGENTRFFNRLRDDELDRPTYEHGLGAARDVAGPLAGGWQGDDAGGGATRTGQQRQQQQMGAQNGFSGLGEDGERLKRKRESRSREETQTTSYGTAEGADAQHWSVSRALLSTVTGVAGMVFHFCTAGAFRGFSAGGGQAWTFNAGGEAGSTVPVARPNEASGLSMEDSWQDADFARNHNTGQKQQDGVMAATPQRRESSSSPTYSYFSPDSSWPSPAARAAKKHKSSHVDDGGGGVGVGGGSALRGNWVLVDWDSDRSRAASPASNASPAGLRRKAGHQHSGSRGSINGEANANFRASIAGSTVRPVTPSRDHAVRTSTPFSTGGGAGGRRRHFTATVSMPVTQISTGGGRSGETTKTPRTQLAKKLASNAALRSSISSSSQPLLRASGNPSFSPSTSSAAAAAAAAAAEARETARIHSSYGFPLSPGAGSGKGTGATSWNLTNSAANTTTDTTSSAYPTSPGKRTPSIATASVRGGDTMHTESPLGKEGERLVRQRARREREEERELTRMNRRLEDMIRQGREALGTRFEVEGDDGFEDEEMEVV